MVSPASLVLPRQPLFHHNNTRTFLLCCPSHGTRWTKTITTAKVHALTRTFVAAALTAETRAAGQQSEA